MFTRKLFEDFFDDIEIHSNNDDVVSQKDITVHNDSWEARFQLIVNMYSIITEESKKKEMSGQNTNNLYVTSNVIKKVFNTLSFVDNFDIEIKMAGKEYAKEIEEPFVVEPTADSQFVMDLVDLKKYNSKNSFNLYVNVYFNIDHETSFSRFYDDVKKLCQIIYNYKVLNLTGADKFYVSKMPAEDNIVYQCNDSLPNMNKQLVKMYSNLINNTFGEDSVVNIDYMNFSKLRVTNKVSEFVSSTNLPVKKAECYVIPRFSKSEHYNKNILIIELNIGTKSDSLGTIYQNTIIREVTEHLFYNEDYNTKLSSLFTVLVIARKEKGADSFKRAQGPYVYDNDKYVSPWKFIKRHESRLSHSKLYSFIGLDGYQYGKIIDIYIAFPDKKNSIVSGDTWRLKYEAHDKLDFMKIFIDDSNNYGDIWTKEKNDWLSKHS